MIVQDYIIKKKVVDTVSIFFEYCFEFFLITYRTRVITRFRLYVDLQDTLHTSDERARVLVPMGTQSRCGLATSHVYASFLTMASFNVKLVVNCKCKRK